MIILLLFFTSIHSKNYEYQFNWAYIPVANLILNFSEIFSVENNSFSGLEFHIKTQGPLKIYRNYSSNGYIRTNDTYSWDYHLLGQDRGKPEEKHITYFLNKAPEIKKFIDDYGESSLVVDSILDNEAIDPFSVLIKTIKQLILEQQCDNEYSVMDGKRRYKIKVELEEEKIISSNKIREDVNKILNCKFTLNEIKEEKRKWPFNKKDRSMNVWFSADLDFLPVRFSFKTPIGRIVGHYIEG